MSDINIWPALEINGGGTGAMDAIDGHDLLDKDRCHVFGAAAGGIDAIYVWDDDSGLSEDYPWIVAADENGGLGRWVCISLNGEQIIYSTSTTTVNLAVTDFRKRYVMNHSSGQKIFNLPNVDSTHIGIAIFKFHYMNTSGNGTIKIVAQATDQIQDSGAGGFFQTTARTGEISIMELVLITETIWGFRSGPLGLWG